MKNRGGFTLIPLLLIVVLVIFAGVSWVANLIHFVGCDFSAPFKAEILHGIGLVTPICVVTAWLNLGQ